MKLITELTSFEKLEVIKESIEVDGQTVKKCYLKGPILEAENRNRNGRIYPHHILKREVDKYVEEKVNTHRALGELNHPANPDVNLDRVSHVFEELYMEGNVGYGKARILDTPMGRIARSLVDEGIVLGMSTRGVGNISEDGIVDETFSLIVAGDLVSDPSCRKAFVEGVLENKEWIISGDGYVEVAVNNMKKMVDKQFNESISAIAIQNFMKDIQSNIRGKMNW